MEVVTSQLANYKFPAWVVKYQLTLI